MRECRRVFSRRSLLWLLVLMAAVVFFHWVDHHTSPGFAAENGGLADWEREWLAEFHAMTKEDDPHGV